MISNDPEDFYELLRKERNELAQKANVKPFMVLHNKVLHELAQKRPKTIEELETIKGMGGKRVAKYGQWILDTINGSTSGSISAAPEEKVYSVSEYINYLNEILTPHKVMVVGEITSINQRGNYTFFSLHDKGEEAILNCFIWQSRLDDLGVELKEGLELKVAGFSRIYEKTGRLTFEAEYIALVGEGALKLAFEKLRKKLATEGYFDLERKRELPDFVAKIGLITSGYGDAIQDFKTHLGEFGMKVFFYDIRVEGFYAVEDIVSAIHWFNENRLGIDVLVLTRGGGSLEQLQPFNSEPVAKAIFGSQIPIISGVGHENDITIADLVADVRASTPTHAARILSDPWKNADDSLSSTQRSILSVFTNIVRNFNSKVLRLEEDVLSAQAAVLERHFQKIGTLQTVLGLQFQKLISQVKQAQLRFFNNYGRLQDNWLRLKNAVNSQERILINENTRWLRFWNESLKNLEQKLQLVNPELRLKQGYSIVQDGRHTVIKNSKQIKISDILTLKFHRGGALSTVKSIEN